MVKIKSEKEIEILREGGRILAEIMDELEKNLKPGRKAIEVDKLAEKLVFSNGGKPSFKGFGKETGNPFPATVCFSANNEVVHGVPAKDKTIKEGDVVKIDIGMEYMGMFTDMARTFLVGNVSGQARKLADVTRESLDIGIEKLRAGNKLSDYSKAVQKYVESHGFSVIRNLVGHGVGYAVHEDPQIPNYYNKKYKEVILKPGMVLALEPMVNEGGFETILAKDGWTFQTKDGKLSAHFEDTVVITAGGAEILTRL